MVVRAREGDLVKGQMVLLTCRDADEDGGEGDGRDEIRALRKTVGSWG
jgi:hypothetical protein